MASEERQYADIPGNESGGKVLVAAAGRVISDQLAEKYGLKKSRKTAPEDKDSSDEADDKAPPIREYTVPALREEAHKRRIDLSGLRTKEEILEAIQSAPDPADDE